MRTSGSCHAMICQRCFLAVITLLFSLHLASAQLIEEWVQRYSSPVLAGPSEGAKVVSDGSGNIIVAGSTETGLKGSDIFVIKYNLAGQALWTNTYNGPVNGYDRVTGLAVGNGKIVVTGYSDDANQQDDYVTIAYSISGQGLWTNRYSGPGLSDEQSLAVAMDSAGNVAVTGYSWTYLGEGGPGSKDYVTIRYSSSGTPVWTNRYSGIASGEDVANSIAVDDVGNVYVSGKSEGSPGYDFATVAYTDTGHALWTNRYQGIAVGMAVADGRVFVTGNSTDQSGDQFYTTIAYGTDGAGYWTNHASDVHYGEAAAIAADPAGNVYVTGRWVNESFHNGFGTIAYSVTGVTLWTNWFSDGAEGTRASAIAVDEAGNVFVTGSYDEVNCVTVGYSALGSAMWTNRYDGSANTLDQGKAVAVDFTGNVFVTGTVDEQAVTLGYSSMGTPLWTNLYAQPGNRNDIGVAVTVDTSGNVYVAGHGYRSSQHSDIILASYSAAGAPRWTKHYGTPFEDQAISLLLDKDENLLVTGQTGFSGTADYVTIKYSADGVPLWTNWYSASAQSDDLPAAMAVDSDGNVFVTGLRQDSRSAFATVGYSGAGVPLWTNQYNRLSNSSDYPVAIEVANNKLFVTGVSYDWISKDIVTIAYSKTGAGIWTNRYGGSDISGGRARGLAVRNGMVVVAGTTDSGYVTLAYSEAGVALWTNYYGPEFSLAEATAVVIDGSGNVFVTGTARDSSGDDAYVTIKYSPAGLGIWTNRYRLEGRNCRVAAIALDPKGNVIVTGSSEEMTLSGELTDYSTVAYSNSGSPLWTNHYNGPANGYDNPIFKSSLTAGSDGAVIVTGISDGDYAQTGIAYDFATVKYSSPDKEPIPLFLQRTGNSVRLSWPNPDFQLQSAGSINGAYTNIPGASSPFTSPITGNQKYFRLMAN